MKYGKKLLLTCLAVIMVIAMLPQTAKAATREQAYDQYGLFFGEHYSGYKSITVTPDGRLQYGESQDVYLDTVTMYKDPETKLYTTDDLGLSVDNEARVLPYEYNRIVGVKTSSKNLKAHIAYTEHSDGYVSTWNGNVTKGDPYDESSNNIELLAKKAGKYKVTISVELKSTEDSKKTIVVTKTANVNVTKKSAPSLDFSKAKWTTDGTIASKTVKPKLVKSSACTDIKTYYSTQATKFVYKNADGDTVTNANDVWKAFKPGKKKIKLNTKKERIYDSSTADTINRNVNRWFYPETKFLITYKDKATGLYRTTTQSVYKYKKL